jgi:two-component system nitrate/nitrite response regulator NarP
MVTPLAKVLLVDDEPDLLENLREWLELMGYAVVAAPDGQAALALARERDFDVVVTDLKMPRMGGHDLLAFLKARDAAVEVIMLTGQGTMQDAIQALREGRAFDFLQKPLRDLRDLSNAIERALSRRRRLAAPQPLPPAPIVEALTERERELLARLAEGLDNREIAQRVALSEGTVRNLLSRLYEKLGVANRTQAVLLYQRPRG